MRHGQRPELADRPSTLQTRWRQACGPPAARSFTQRSSTGSHCP
jgi:hypothetical protein